MKTEPNPNPDLFTTFERVEKCHRAKVTEDNMHQIAKFFDWGVQYANGTPTLWKPGGSTVEAGSWIDQRGSRWNPEPLTQGWSPEGTFTAQPTNEPAVAGEETSDE